MELSLENNLMNNINNEIGKNQQNFLETTLGKTINSAIDIGIKAALPNLIEDQVINIKDTILEQGFKEGLKEVINSGIDIGKSVTGVVTGNFESISQIQAAVKNGGILDSVSKLLDNAINLANKNNLINNTIATLIKQSKNTIISSMSNKIEETLTNQLKAVEKVENYCEKWNTYYANKDFSKMETAYKNIDKYLNQIIPLEDVINNARKIENIHELIKNNGKNFNLAETEIELAAKLTNT